MGKAKKARFLQDPHSNKLSKRQQDRVKELEAQPVAGLRPEVFSGVFSATLFASAALLFMVQPMIAKMLLPLLGGVPSVWTTCMLFFQMVLLAGYLYAHLLTSRCNVKKQFLIHGGLLVASALFLPLGLKFTSLIYGDMSRIAVVLVVLACSVGLPFFTLSASAPLLQQWFSKTGHFWSRDPYFLYAASNLGSMVTLIAYPFVIEPVIGIHAQTFVWTAGYALLLVLFSATAYLLNRAQAQNPTAEEASEVIPFKEREEDVAPGFFQILRWIGLAFVPSSLMLGVTTYFTTDIATIPLLWIVPLSLYLVSFVVVFGKVPNWVYRWGRRIVPFAILGLICTMISHGFYDVFVNLFIHLGTFFLVTFVFHGEIAQTRPSAKYLTGFYLWMSFGGMMGGLFNGALAPIIFKSAAEYPIALVVACILLPMNLKIRRNTEEDDANDYSTFHRVLDFVFPVIIGGLSAWLVIKWPLLNYTTFEGFAKGFGTEIVELHRIVNYAVPAALCLAVWFFRRNLRFGLCVGAFLYANLNFGYLNQDIIHQERSFFGILKVSSDSYDNFRTLTNGTTLHGRQAMVSELRKEPLTYYHRLGPVGTLFEEFYGSDRPQHYGAIGLGTGSLSAYGRPGIKMTIFEIDQAVRRIASEYFHYLEDSQADVNIVMGDARLNMEKQADGQFGLILVDAFSSDSIPVHLLTKEALELYFKKVGKNGLVAIHTSNRYLSLEPVLANLAKDLGLQIRVNHDKEDMTVGKLASTWVLLTRDVAGLGNLAKNPAWIAMESRPSYPHWTDDFTSVLTILR